MPHESPHRPDERLRTLIETPPVGDDPAAERRRRAETLVAAVGDSRDRLEGLRALYLQRLHRASDDYRATEALRVIETAIALVAFPESVAEPVAAQGRRPLAVRSVPRRRADRDVPCRPVNQAFDDSAAGATVKPVVLFG